MYMEQLSIAYEKIKRLVVLEYIIPFIIVVVICCYLERKKILSFIFHVNNSSDFEISASRLRAAP